MPEGNLPEQYMPEEPVKEEDIAHVNRFEFGLDPEPIRSRRQGIHFTKDQRRDLTCESAEKLFENPKILKSLVIEFFEKQVPRLVTLESYDTADNQGIMQGPRRLEHDKADYRARHAFASYISTFQNGYLFGIPVGVEHDDTEIKEFIDEYSKINDIDALNSDLGYDASRFGRAFEVHYRNEDDEDRVALSDVFETFVIRDTTVEKNVIAGVRCPVTETETGKSVAVTLYLKDTVVEYEPVELHNGELKIREIRENPYGDIPIIEWRNNRERMGDYEKVISLIDLYDAAQSDTANYNHDLNDALLVLYGDIDADKYDAKDLAAMKRANLMVLESGIGLDGRQTNVKAEYLYKQYDVQGKEAYLKRLQDDIHKFSYTPDLTDEKFAGAQSGIAMEYKLFGLKQQRSQKQRLFEKAIRKRYELVSNLHQRVREIDLDSNNLRIIFTENLPEDEWGEISDLYSVGGQLSEQTLLERLSFIEDVKEEMKKVEKEKEENMRRFEDQMFNPHPLDIEDEDGEKEDDNGEEVE